MPLAYPSLGDARKLMPEKRAARMVIESTIRPMLRPARKYSSRFFCPLAKYAPMATEARR